jgi:hypothetical protein
VEIQLPRTLDRDALLGPLAAGEIVRGSWAPLYTLDANYRREITRRNVLRFVLVYLSHLLRGPNTGGVMSMSRLHVDMARAALRWTDQGQPFRDWWVAPRGAAKSTWSMGCVLWALAHGWRRTVLLYSDTNDQIRTHMGDLRRELERNDLLREDYPQLIPDRRVRGTVDTTYQIVGQLGQSVTARSMGTSDLGLKVAGGRPDLVVLDDIESDGQTDRERTNRLEKIQNVVVPMNPRAVVQGLGTVVGWGSLSHEVVRAAIGDGDPADWITGMGFRPRYYPAVIPAGVTEDGEPVGERSLWPAAWPLAWLQDLQEREPGNYALNYQGQPSEPGGEHWTAQTFRYRRWPTLGDVVHVDPAVTVTATSDETAVCVLGNVDLNAWPSSWIRPAVPPVLVHYVRGRRVTGSQLRTWLVRMLSENPHVTTVVLEENAGGDWAEILLRPRVDGRDPWPASVRLVLYRATEPKRDRFHTLEGRYERLEIVHGKMFPELERQMIRYPHVPHDDLMDTIAGGVEYLRNPHRKIAAGTASERPFYRVVNPADYGAVA